MAFACALAAKTVRESLILSSGSHDSEGNRAIAAQESGPRQAKGIAFDFQF